MSQSHDNGPKRPPDDRATVFVPSGAGAPEDSTGPSHAGDDAESDNLTTPPSTPAAAPQGQEAYASIKVGDCLNHIYEVKRFIARGGMGEVFEGVNVTSDERVAIKVMLPALAADPNVIAMFRREARAMTRLQHEALVQYRVLAQEPRSGVLYIVTEYIDGVPLCDVLGTLKPSPDQLRKLLRRLASGLRAAHQLGVLHRDISPDNVLLEGGDIERAKIVDFGIAKDLNPGSATIVGEGFAGKLGYVAPEQLGDFNRELGPWTDVYSLGLVMAAATVGRDLKMGGTLVDAVDRRRAGPDLADVPEELKPILAAMLRPNPTDRLRSMDDVLAMLDPVSSPAPSPAPTGPEANVAPARSRLVPLIGGGAVLLVLLLAGLWFAIRPSETPVTSATPSSRDSVQSVPNQPPPGDPLQRARATINSIIPSVACSWLNVVSVTGDSRQLAVVMAGVAGDPSEAQSEVMSALRGAGFTNANADFSAIAPIEPGGCAAINAYRQFRNTDATRLTTAQRLWTMQRAAQGNQPGKLVANPIIRFAADDSRADLTLFGIEPSGVIGVLFSSRKDLDAAVASSLADVRKGAKETNPTKIGPDQYEVKLNIDHEGWSGLVLLTGRGPFPADVVTPPLGARNMAWQNRFATMADRQGWKADMLWFKVESQRGAD